ncbi:MAG: hypothetical protein V3571_07360 [Pseudodesulfovibrio sp.]
MQERGKGRGGKRGPGRGSRGCGQGIGARSGLGRHGGGRGFGRDGGEGRFGRGPAPVERESPRPRPDRTVPDRETARPEYAGKSLRDGSRSAVPTAGNCPLCDNHCPLGAPGCPKGAAYARSLSIKED